MANEENAKKSNKGQDVEHNSDLGAFNANRAKEAKKSEDLLKGKEKEELLEGMQKEELLESAPDEKLLMDEKDTKLVELTENLQRVAAEFDNYKKRVAKERGEQAGMGNAKMIEKLLPFLDEFELASAAAEKSSDEILKNGMKLMYGKFRKLLEAEGLQEMNPVGEKFDPYRHEAAMQECVEGKEEGMIVRVIRKGYMLNGKILRHAMVSVCKKE
jgi:molecular chaperone GrpE